MKEFALEFILWICSNYETPYLTTDEDMVMWDVKDNPWKEPYSTEELYNIFIEQKSQQDAITKTKG